MPGLVSAPANVTFVNFWFLSVSNDVSNDLCDLSLQRLVSRGVVIVSPNNEL